MSVATARPTRPVGPARLLLVAALLAALFAGALLLGRSGGHVAGATGPALQHGASGGSLPVDSPPASAALPRLRHPAPKPTAVQAPPTTIAPTTPVAPTVPAPSTGGSTGGGSGGGGGGGGGVLISG
jgi:hypothetical protein